MLPYYKTVRQEGIAEIVIRRSRFIGHSMPVSTEEEAWQYIERIRSEHSQATHNCYAYKVGERDQFQKQSDDGEPSGTAGKPIMEVINHHDLKNVVVVVTRYFGGVMLGAGGLIRAYTEGAVSGITAGEPVYQVLHQEVLVEMDYTWLGKMENELHTHGIVIGEIAYAEQVTIPCYPLASEAEKFIAWMTDVTQGQGKMVKGKLEYRAHDQLPMAKSE